MSGNQGMSGGQGFSADNFGGGIDQPPPPNTTGGAYQGGFQQSGFGNNGAMGSAMNTAFGGQGGQTGGFPGWGSNFNYAPSVQNPLPHQSFDGTTPNQPPPPTTPPPNTGLPPPPPPPLGDLTRPPVFGTNPPPRGNPPPVGGGRIINGGTNPVVPPVQGYVPPRQGSPMLPNQKIGLLGGGINTPPDSGINPPPPPTDPNAALYQAIATGQGGGNFSNQQINQAALGQGGGQGFLPWYKQNQAQLNRQGPMYQKGGMFYNPAIDGQ